MNFSDNKAGLQGLDKEKIERIIAENTSANFDSHAQKRKQRIDERVAQNKRQLEAITEDQIEYFECEIQSLIENIEATERRLDRVCVHIDMDAFFAAVEMRDHPQLRAIPMAVGGDAMLSTSNYLARKFGVRSAMPGFIGRKLCPSLTIVRANYSKYQKESAVIRSVFQRFDSAMSMASLDEAYMDITRHLEQRLEPVRCKRIRYKKGGCECFLPLSDCDEANEDECIGASLVTEKCVKCNTDRVSIIDYVTFGVTPDEAVQQIRFEVEQATGLTCSAGIAPNRMLAKICSDMRKPNGQFRLESDRDLIISFMRTLPIRKVSGIGAVSEAVLKGLGIETCGELFRKRAIIRLLFSDCSFQWFLRVSLGISGVGGGNVKETQSHHQKSTSVERTFQPSRDQAKLAQILRELSNDLMNSLQDEGIEGGKTATLKVKFASFDVITRSQSVTFLIQSSEVLYSILEGILRRELKNGSQAVRLLGVRLSHLEFSLNPEDFDLSNFHLSNSAKQKSLNDYVKRPIGRKGLKNALNDTNQDWPIIELDDEDEENDGHLANGPNCSTNGADVDETLTLLAIEAEAPKTSADDQEVSVDYSVGYDDENSKASTSLQPYLTAIPSEGEESRGKESTSDSIKPTLHEFEEAEIIFERYQKHKRRQPMKHSCVESKISRTTTSAQRKPVGGKPKANNKLSTSRNGKQANRGKTVSTLSQRKMDYYTNKI